MKNAALFSPCGAYRYRLSRAWADGPTAAFVMLNPSTADATKDDPTIRRCIGFAKREGCGGLVVVNIFAFRATSPADMRAADDPIGPDNDEHIMDALVDADGPVVAAWGSLGSYRGRDHDVRLLTDVPLWCLGLTKAGAPRHPLYVKGDAPLLPF
jgi:hypothetical protein